MATRIGLLAEVGGELCRVKRGGGLLGGYMCDILTENLSERELSTYMCPRCEGIMKDGSISNVGEHFCACCIEEGEHLQCNVPIYSTILSLKCSCPLSKRGCDWLGTLGSIEDHLTTCGYVYVSCRLKCGMVLKNDKMSWHVREECSQREESCMHCSETQKVCEMTEHVKACEMVEMECELGCGTRVRRESIMSHRNSVCLEEMVVCPYAKYRCEVARLKRRELEQHLEESRMLHVELKLDTMAEKIKVLEFQITMKNERIQHLEEECQIRTEGTVKWNITNIYAFLKPRKGPRYSNAKRIAGYPFYLGHESTDESFDIFFYTGLKYLMKENVFEKLELLDWPLRVIFITRVICRENLKSSLTLKSPLVELLQTDFGKLFSNSKPICSIPLSTNWENFIQSESLYLEVTLRILKNKY